MRISETLLKLLCRFCKTNPSIHPFSKQQLCFLTPSLFISSGVGFSPDQKKKILPWNSFFSLLHNLAGYLPPLSHLWGDPNILSLYPLLKSACSARSPVTVIPPRDPPRSGHPRWEMAAGRGPGWWPGIVFQGLGFAVRLTWARSWLLLSSAVPLCVSEFSFVKLGLV